MSRLVESCRDNMDELCLRGILASPLYKLSLDQRTKIQGTYLLLSPMFSRRRIHHKSSRFVRSFPNSHDKQQHYQPKPKQSCRADLPSSFEACFSVIPQVLSPSTATELRQHILTQNKLQAIKDFQIYPAGERESIALNPQDHPIVAQALEEITNHPILRYVSLAL